MTGCALGKIKRPKFAKDKRVAIGMRLYAENNAEGYLIARKRGPRGGGICVGVVLSEPAENGFSAILFLENKAPRATPQSEAGRMT